MARYLILAVVLLSACTAKKDYTLSITIDDAFSYTYDLTNRTMTVYNTLKPDTVVHFSLTSQELKNIIDKYYALNLQALKTGTTLFRDSCMVMPKLLTVLKVHAKNFYQEITIDEDCSQFPSSEEHDASQVLAFLKYISTILDAKKEIKDSRHSDIIYL